MANSSKRAKAEKLGSVTVTWNRCADTAACVIAFRSKSQGNDIPFDELKAEVASHKKNMTTAINHLADCVMSQSRHLNLTSSYHGLKVVISTFGNILIVEWVTISFSKPLDFMNREYFSALLEPRWRIV